jgi:hypothetical protein
MILKKKSKRRGNAIKGLRFYVNMGRSQTHRSWDFDDLRNGVLKEKNREGA